MTVFPPRNLPGEADKWGRVVEDRIEGVESALDLLSSVSGNNGRFTGGQLAVQGAQITEQFNRTTLRVRAADLSVTGNATIEPFPRASRSVVFNPPDGARVAQVEVYAKWSGSPTATVNMYAYLSYAGNIVSRLDTTFDTNQVQDTGVVTQPRLFSGFANVILPKSGNAVFTLTIVRGAFTSSTTTETFTDIDVFLTPFQKTV